MPIFAGCLSDLRIGDVNDADTQVGGFMLADHEPCVPCLGRVAN
ncbi:MAG: hypothetical protein U0X20_19075 [Caldilineaceae bacterium]